MAGQTGPRGFRPGPQGQYQNQPAPIGYNPGQQIGGGPTVATGGAAGALGGGGRVGLGSNLGGGGDMGRGLPGGTVSTPRADIPLGGGGDMGRGLPGGSVSLPSPTFPGGTGGAGAFPPAGPGGVPAGGFPSSPPIGSSMLTSMPDTTTATQIPQEASPAQNTVPGYPPTPGSLQKLPGGGYSGMGPAGKPITYGKVMPGPIRRS